MRSRRLGMGMGGRSSLATIREVDQQEILMESVVLCDAIRSSNANILRTVTVQYLHACGYSSLFRLLCCARQAPKVSSSWPTIKQQEIVKHYYNIEHQWSSGAEQTYVLLTNMIVLSTERKPGNARA